jgi:DNA-binding transcriptional MerR regulator
VPYKTPIIEKHFYTIGEVADIFGVNTSLIRFWEKNFDNIKPHKNKKGNRLFTKDAIEEIRMVHYLVKERGMTLKGAQQKIKENPADTVHEHEVVKQLKSIREMLVEIKNEI